MEDKKFNFDKLYAVDSETEYYSNLSVEELKAKLVKINEEKEKIVKYLSEEKINNRERFIREIEKCKSIIGRIHHERDNFFGDTYSEDSMLKLYYEFTYGIPETFKINSNNEEEERNAEACLMSKGYLEWKEFFLNDNVFEAFKKYMLEKGNIKDEFGFNSFNIDVQNFIIKYNDYLAFLSNFFDITESFKSTATDKEKEQFISEYENEK